MSGPIVIVGAGLAGSRAAGAIREYGHAGPVLMLGAEQAWPYQRPALKACLGQPITRAFELLGEAKLVEAR